MGFLNFFKMESVAAAKPVPAEKVDKTYKRMRIQTFLAATFGYALYYVCRLSMGVMKQPLIDAGLLTATQLGIIGACLYWAYAIGKLINGFLADSANIKRFMAAGLVVSVAMNFTMGVLGVNALNGNIVVEDTRNTVVNIQEGYEAVVEGLDHHLVALRDKSLLVCRLDDEQNIKHWIERL